MEPGVQRVSEELCAAYRATTYRVDVCGGSFDLRIDEPHAAMAQWLRNAGKTSAAVITAWNPHSRPTAPPVNARRQRQLQRVLHAQGLEWLPACNLAPIDGATPSSWNEDSLLVPGIDVESARTIAARFGQVAFVWFDQHATPRLVFTAAGMPGA